MHIHTQQRQVSSTSYFELTTAVCDEPSPELPSNNASFSPQLRDFLRLCLLKDPDARPSAAALLAHPFLIRIPRHPRHPSNASSTEQQQQLPLRPPASPLGSKAQRMQLARRELQQVADALAAHFSGGGSIGSSTSGSLFISRRPSCLKRSASVGASGVGLCASSTSGLGGSEHGIGLSGAQQQQQPQQAASVLITALQLRRLADNLRLDVSAVREALQGRLQGLATVALEADMDPSGGGGGGVMIRHQLSCSSSSSSLLGLWTGPQQHRYASSSMSPTRRTSSLAEAAATTGAAIMIRRLSYGGGKADAREQQPTRRRPGRARAVVNCCHMM